MESKNNILGSSKTDAHLCNGCSIDTEKDNKEVNSDANLDKMTTLVRCILYTLIFTPLFIIGLDDFQTLVWALIIEGILICVDWKIPKKRVSHLLLMLLTLLALNIKLDFNNRIQETINSRYYISVDEIIVNRSELHNTYILMQGLVTKVDPNGRYCVMETDGDNGLTSIVIHSAELSDVRAGKNAAFFGVVINNEETNIILNNASYIELNE